MGLSVGANAGQPCYPDTVPQPTPVPDTAPSEVRDNPLLAERRRAEEAEAELARLRARVAPEPLSRRIGQAVTQTRTGQLGALAAALAVIVTAASPIVTAWMDVGKLRAELAETKAELGKVGARAESLERWQLQVGEWRTGVDAYRSREDDRDAWRDRVLCRTGNKASWRVELTCPVPARVGALRVE